MKTKLLLVASAALTVSACGYSVMDAAEDISGSDNGLANGTKISTANTKIGAFTELEGVGPDNIIYVVGDTFSIKAEGNDEALATLRYKLEEGSLRIGRTRGKWFGNSANAANITITAPFLDKAAMAGSGDFTADAMTADGLDLSIAGSGNIKVGALTGKKLDVSIAGSGEATLAGKVDKAEYSIAGAGTVDAAKLATTDAEVSIAGSGDLKLNATGTVEVSIAGSGDVEVTGGAKCTTSKMGSGNVTCS
ncbi:head GIN domain-containing protein [Sphingorhabdus sp.]|uniref:head GIN domain-containing protein n=1 Tax=Sphingorhabdus sp. TaxID=1902408 RepID=UPI0035930228